MIPSRNVLPEDLPLYSIRAGSSSSRVGGQVVNIAAVYRHPDYQAYLPKNDIAVIILEAPIIFGDVKPAKLPKRDFEIRHVSASCKVYVWVTFSGWGALDYTDQPCDVLQTSFVPLIDDNICESLYGKSFDDTKQLCATEEARANCQGDSGSGLVLDDILVGVVTFSAGCPNDKTPAAYLKITGYLDFIEKYMSQTQFSSS
jgi:trypsin